MTVYDVAIVGSGPAGLTAGIYASRGNLKTILFAGDSWGGQLMLTTEVENYPGFPEGIMGPELMDNVRKQAERFGTEIVMRRVTGLQKVEEGFEIMAGEERHKAKSVIVAAGADTVWLGVEGEERLRGRGVSSCATCDAAFFRDKRVMIIGGGDSAMEEALFLTKFASEVIVVHRRDSFKASKIMANRVLNHEKISVFWDSEVVSMLGEQVLDSLTLRTAKDRWKADGTEMQAQADGEVLEEEGNVIIWKAKTNGVFVAIGHRPNTKWLDSMLVTDEKGYLETVSEVSSPLEDIMVWWGEKKDPIAFRKTYPSMSNVEGIFIAGDVHDHMYRQAVTAAAYGCMAAIECERWLEEIFGVSGEVASW